MNSLCGSNFSGLQIGFGWLDWSFLGLEFPTPNAHTHCKDTRFEPKNRNSTVECERNDTHSTYKKRLHSNRPPHLSSSMSVPCSHRHVFPQTCFSGECDTHPVTSQNHDSTNRVFIVGHSSNESKALSIEFFQQFHRSYKNLSVPLLGVERSQTAM